MVTADEFFLVDGTFDVPGLRKAIKEERDKTIQYGLDFFVVVVEENDAFEAVLMVLKDPMHSSYTSTMSGDKEIFSVNIDYKKVARKLLEDKNNLWHQLEAKREQIEDMATNEIEQHDRIVNLNAALEARSGTTIPSATTSYTITRASVLALLRGLSGRKQELRRKYELRRS